MLRPTAAALGTAWQALVANRTRGLLTTLGIVIGIVGVVTTMTAANGLSSSFRESVSALGADVLYVSRMPWVMRGNWFEFRNRPHLTFREVRELERRLRTAVAVNPTLTTQKPVKFQSEVLRRVDVVGTTDKHMAVSSSSPAVGRFLNPHEVAARRRVVVLGHEVAERLFGKSDPLNRGVWIGRAQWRVIGVMEKVGSASFFGGPNFDSQVFVPVTAFTSAFGGAERDFNIAVKAPAADRRAMEAFAAELQGEMRKLRRLRPAEKDNFSINEMDALVGMFNNVMGVVVLIGMAITGISLLVGGIGVMNIMFVSVTERTREIGVRRALGARRSVILTQFLAEAASICLAGGLAGLALAALATEVIDRTLIPATVSPGIALVALAVSVVVGMGAGLVPAWRAARIDTIEALRYE